MKKMRLTLQSSPYATYPNMATALNQSAPGDWELINGLRVDLLFARYPRTLADQRWSIRMGHHQMLSDSRERMLPKGFLLVALRQSGICQSHHTLVALDIGYLLQSAQISRVRRSADLVDSMLYFDRLIIKSFLSPCILFHSNAGTTSPQVSSIELPLGWDWPRKSYPSSSMVG